MEINLSFLLGILKKSKDRGIKNQLIIERQKLEYERINLIARYAIFEEYFTKVHRQFDPELDSALEVDCLNSMYGFKRYADNQKVRSLMDSFMKEIRKIDSCLKTLGE